MHVPRASSRRSEGVTPTCSQQLSRCVHSTYECVSVLETAFCFGGQLLQMLSAGGYVASQAPPTLHLKAANLLHILSNPVVGGLVIPFLQRAGRSVQVRQVCDLAVADGCGLGKVCVELLAVALLGVAAAHLVAAASRVQQAEAKLCLSDIALNGARHRARSQQCQVLLCFENSSRWWSTPLPKKWLTGVMQQRARSPLKLLQTTVTHLTRYGKLVPPVGL